MSLSLLDIRLGCEREDREKLPEGKAVMPGFKANRVGSGTEALLLKVMKSNDKKRLKAKQLRFSISVGLDIHGDNGEVLVDVKTGRGTLIGVWDIRYSHPLQPFVMDVAPDHLEEIFSDGIELSCAENKSGVVWVMTDFEANREGWKSLLPRLVDVKEQAPLKAFREKFFSLGAHQPFGWILGCALDGLADYARGGDAEAKRVLEEHWRYLKSGEGQVLQYCDPRSQLRVNEIYGREAGTPLGTLDICPDRKIAELYREFLFRFDEMEEQGGENNDYTTEGCYTVAYPAAVVGRLLEDQAVLEVSAKVIRRRIHALWDGKKLIQGKMGKEGSPRFVNWARGITWAMLGTVKSAQRLEPEINIEEFRTFFREMADWVIQFPRVNGVWASYVDDIASGAETSGGAGIAAALAVGIHAGWLSPSKFLPVVEEARDGLSQFITVDGWLDGISQINRGGDALQRQGYRVLSQMGMGLFAQLDANANAIP